MFCTKCGGELQEGDSFCGKCGARIEKFASAVEPKTEPAVAAQPPQPRTKNGLKLPPKRTVKILPKGEMAARSEKRRAEKAVEDKVRAELARAGKIGEGLGKPTILSDLFGDALMDTGCGGILFCLPLALLMLVNPLTWVMLSSKSQARDALSAGNLDLAERLKKKGSLFQVLAFIITLGAFVLVVYSIFGSVK